jgi:hypothetical protein
MDATAFRVRAEHGYGISGVSTMKKLTIVIALFLCFANALAQSKRIGTFQFQTKKAGHRVKVIFRVRAFDPTKKVGYDPKIGNTVNGRKAYGAEGIPEAEIASISFFFDGRKIRIPRRLYSDCYDPDLHDNPLTIRFGLSPNTARMSMWGSDGAGGYQVIWVLRRNGRQTRFFSVLG